MKEITVEAAKGNLEVVLDFISTEMKEKKVPEELQNILRMAAEEVFVNIVHYAYKPSKGDVTARIDVSDRITMEFEDTGKHYNPLENEEPDIYSPIGERKIGGLGIFIVKKIMDSVEYRYENGRNILTMKKSNLHAGG